MADAVESLRFGAIPLRFLRSRSDKTRTYQAGAVLERLVAAGTHDFCPWANRYVYWLKQPIGWFIAGVFAAALTAYYLEPQMWVVLGALVGVTLLGVVWPWLAMRGATAELSFDRRRCREGEPVTVRLKVMNSWPLPLWGLAIENGFFVVKDQDGETERPLAAIERVSGWSCSEFAFEFTPASRGVYPRQVVQLATGFPFGIWRCSKEAPVDGELLVWPATTNLMSIPALRGDIADVIGALFDRSGYEGDVIGARQYRPGDTLRSIHWAHSARRESMVVTERQAAARQPVVVSVDLAAFVRETGGTSAATLETAIRVAASIAREFHTHHAEVRFIIGELDFVLEPGTAGLHRLLDALARFQQAESKLDQLPSFDRRSLAIVVTVPSKCDYYRQIHAPALRVLIDNDASSEPRENAWITIDASAKEDGQLRGQWERACHASMAK